MANDMIENFRRYYEVEGTDWGGGSGAGSDPFYVLPYRAFLESFIHLNNIRTIVDIGCGDWVFSRFLDLRSVQYRGYDIVESVVKNNQIRFGADNIIFDIMPSDINKIPAADLLIMKDVLQHLPDADIFRFKHDLFDRFSLCLLTNSHRKVGCGQNYDISQYGDFRCLDLNAAPYNFRGTYLLEFNTPLWEESRTLLYTGKNRP